MLCIDKTPPSHLISAIYNLICDTPPTVKTSFQISWEKELDRTISLEDWSKSFLLTHKSTISSKAQELHFKVLSRWYRVPSLLHAIYPNTSHLCWRCNGAEGTMTHIWWGCPVLQPFWIKVIDVIQKITGIQLANDPASLLLFMIPLPTSAVRRSLLSFLLTAAKLVIPRLWKSQQPPTLTSWFTEISVIQRMEEMRANNPTAAARSATTWSDWIEFSSSPEFHSMH